MANCPRCQVEVSELHSVDADVIARLNQMGGESPPAQVCAPCRSELRKLAASASGGVLLAQERAKEQNRLMMWKNRVQLIRNARQLMSEKAYSEAAVNYEKYLRVLQIVLQCPKGEQLTPEMFKDNARTSELTVVASVYWDLLRIYDTSSKYGDRQKTAAKQLAVFVRFTPVFPDIIRKAEAFVKQSKNPDVIKSFLKASADSRPRCFIATSAFENPMAAEILILRNFRDQNLKSNALGRKFVFYYYKMSPNLAKKLDYYFFLKPVVRSLIKILVFILKMFMLTKAQKQIVTRQVLNAYLKYQENLTSDKP